MSLLRYFFLALMLLPFAMGSAQTIIMPHQGVDTLIITDNGCYTILDPGGTGKYQNNEDSYLYIISNNYGYMHFQVQYELSHVNDGKDWLRIYSDTADWAWYDEFGGEGKRESSVNTYRALIHFHSNAYNTYDGFIITVEQQSTMGNYTSTPLSPTSVRVDWDDYDPNASSWTVYYTCDDDTLLSATSNYTSVILNGLQPNRSYRYHIVNNIVPCIYKQYNWFATVGDSSRLFYLPNTWYNDTIPNTRCYTMTDPAAGTNTMEIPGTSHVYNFNNGNGVYLRGDITTLTGRMYLYYRTVDGGSSGNYFYYWDNTHQRSYYQWFPQGNVDVYVMGKASYNFEVLPENSSVITPSVSGVTGTSASISWTDNSASTSWTVRYTDNESNWQQASATTTSVSLTGLTPGRQYVYTIAGNDTSLPCMVPARHAFITTGIQDDTILMPYRGNQTILIQPRRCYTVTDGGGNGGYFHTDFSRLVLRTANHKGFRLKGSCNLNGNDRICIYDGRNWNSYGGDDYRIEVASISDSLVVCFQSDANINKNGFALQVLQVEDSITGLTASNITTSSATISWTDISDATSWTVHYGLSEDQMQTVTTTTNSVTLNGLTSARQYVYYVTNGSGFGNCAFSERKGFITLGLPSYEVVLPFRGIDTLILQPGTCYHIWDPGGKDGNYFNNDTATLVIMSADGSDFNLVGEWLSDGNEFLYRENGYDSYDRVWLQNNPYDDNYYNAYDGWYCRHNTQDRIRYGSWDGYLRMRFTSNSYSTATGFCFTIESQQNNVSNVQLTRVTSNLATVNWEDNGSSPSWTVAYGPVGGYISTVTALNRNYTLTGLQPNTLYQVTVYTFGGQQCGSPTAFFTTLGPDAIVMPAHGSDTVYITPGQCYYVYDPGGTGNYLPSDSSYLVIRSTTGEGFYASGSGNVGNRDYSDYVYIENVSSGVLWWGWETWINDGEQEFAMITNEALQEAGFYQRILFPSRTFNPDTLNMTDSTVTITWQDTSGANQWVFSYGPHVDSLTTVTTNVKQYTMTGLERNRQYFYSIYNTIENQQCVLPNFYGVIMPTDPGVIIDPYINHYLRYPGRYSLYHQSYITLSPNNCYHFMDEGGIGKLFANSDNGFTLYTENNQGITIQGYYDLGSSSIWISTNQYGSWYYNSGYLNIYAPDGYVHFDQRSGTSPTDFATGYNWEVSFNYRIYNVRTQNVTCNSATLLWDDSTSATQWTLAYGPTEKQLDTVTVNTKSINLSNLLPDHQYVCYISSNDSALTCYRPVKYTFITTCDTTVFLFPFDCDTTRILDINECYTIYDAGGDMDYLYHDRHYVWLRSSTGNPMTLRGSIHMGDNDYLYAWDAGTGSWIGGWSEVDNLVIEVPSGYAQFEYNSGGDTITGSGFEFTVSFLAVSNIEVSLKTDSTCRLTWDDNTSATQWVCHYGMDKNDMDSIVTNQRMVHLSNLVYGKRYYVYFTNNSVACIDTTWFDFCAGGDKCVEFGDIYSCFATAYSGRFNNPNEYKGMIDYGPDDINSRHTLIDDTSATDPRTGNQLRCVPPGYPNAVRLGNWDIGGEAESITYEYDVDTTKSEILLLRYAAVLENPGHSPSMQPRFRFSLVDEYNNDINTDCYSADFVSGDSLGWNVYRYDTNTVLWKDWTAVGVDLAPLHGQRVYVKLTTYDCNEMGHFGYAYFTLECEEKEIMPNECGVVHANTFSAPEGFRYRWYNIDSSDVTLSTDRTFSSTQNGIYRCRASFLGSTGESCYFEKTVVVGDIFPYANYSYEIVDTNECDVTVQFYNLSCVTLDSANMQPTSMECDGYVWDFGDGTVSYDKHPMHIFPSREFNITLTASLASGSCSDDTTMTVLMRSPCIAFDTVYPEICDGDTFALRDSAYTTTGFYTVRTEYRPDSIVTTFVFLTVHPTLDTSLQGGICDGNAYTLFGFNETVAGDYNHLFTSIYGCDSNYHLHLVVAHSYDTTFPGVACSNIGYAYRDTVFFVSTVYTDSLLSIYLCDSVVTLNITVNPAYELLYYDTLCDGDSLFFGTRFFSQQGSYTDSLLTNLLCDSVQTLFLHVNPVYNTFDTDYFCQNTPYIYSGNEYWTPQLIIDSLHTVNICDSTVHIDIRYYDSTFRANAFFSLDSLSWMPLDSGFLAGCFPLPVFFYDSALNATDNRHNAWYFGDESNPATNKESLQHLYADSGIFAVTHILSSDDGCVDSVLATVQVFPLPIPAFEDTPDLITILEPEATLINQSYPNNDSSSFLWYFYQHSGSDEAPVDSSTAVNPVYTWINQGEDLTGDHDVKLIAYQLYTTLIGDSLVCLDSIRQPVNIVNIFLQFPTAVTPNGDGVNDTWHIVNIEYGLYPVNRLRIYDRWGRLVFKRDNITTLDDNWDPNETHSPDGTYFYRFDCQGKPGFIQHNGAIEVIR